MRWPFIIRDKYDDVIRANIRLCVTIEERDEQILELQKRISALNSIISQKSVMITLEPDVKKPKRTKNTKQVSNTRSGWRSRAANLSDSTVPAPRDSARALEEKVKREGGKI